MNGDGKVSTVLKAEGQAPDSGAIPDVSNAGQTIGSPADSK